MRKAAFGFNRFYFVGPKRLDKYTFERYTLYIFHNENTERKCEDRFVWWKKTKSDENVTITLLICFCLCMYHVI